MYVSNVNMDRDGFYYSLTSDGAPIDHLHFHKEIKKKWKCENWKVGVNQIYYPKKAQSKRTLEIVAEWEYSNVRPWTGAIRTLEETVTLEVEKNDNHQTKVNELFTLLSTLKTRKARSIPFEVTSTEDAVHGKVWKIKNPHKHAAAWVRFNATLCHLLGMSYPHEIKLLPTAEGSEVGDVSLSKGNTVEEISVLFDAIPKVLKLELDFVETKGMSDENYDNDMLVRWTEENEQYCLWEPKNPQYRDVKDGSLESLGLKFKSLKEEDLFDYKDQFMEGKEFNTRVILHFKPALERIYKSPEESTLTVTQTREITPDESVDETEIPLINIKTVEEKQGGDGITIFDVEKNAGF